jgi:hypothetical protein
MAWSPADILESNPAESGQLKSPLNQLLDVAGANLVILSDVANELERRQAHVIGLFQLPYHIHVEPSWHRVLTLEDGLYAECKFIPCLVETDNFRTFRLFPSAIDKGTAIAQVTQVMAAIPVWGRRALFHERYMHHAARGGSDTVIVPQRDSWVDNRPLFFGDYETNFASRVIREFVAALRNFLPAYSIKALRHAPIPPLLYSYHAMLAPGRVVYAGQNVSVLGALMASQKELDASTPISAADLSSAMQTRYRSFSNFELQLFALERLRRDGEVSLALIGGPSLLEWLLNLYLLGQGGKKQRTYSTHFAINRLIF